MHGSDMNITISRFLEVQERTSESSSRREYDLVERKDSAVTPVKAVVTIPDTLNAESPPMTYKSKIRTSVSLITMMQTLRCN